jgi:hypothetical protein
MAGAVGSSFFAFFAYFAVKDLSIRPAEHHRYGALVVDLLARPAGWRA